MFSNSYFSLSVIKVYKSCPPHLTVIVVKKQNNDKFIESSVKEALGVEPGALMIWSVVERWSKGGGGVLSVAPSQSFLIRLNIQVTCGGHGLTLAGS